MFSMETKVLLFCHSDQHTNVLRGVTPLYGLYRYVRSQRVGFLAVLHKQSIDFGQFINRKLDKLQSRERRSCLIERWISEEI